jgi:dienelactone hydrolase
LTVGLIRGETVNGILKLLVSRRNESMMMRDVLVSLALAAALVLGMDARASSDIKETDETFKSRGKDFVVDVFAPEAPGKYPAIVVLHGHGGLGEGKRSGCHEAARRLARAGYVAMVPHYFGRAVPDPKNARKNAQSFAVWERAVSDTVGFAMRRADVDPKRVGLLGFSLGSYVSIGVAARDRRVSAVVENYGGLPEHEDLNWSRLPPVLILHGDADKVVSVDSAHALDQVLDEANVFHEVKIYPGAGHGFRGDDHQDASRRTLEFFDKYVKR